MAAGQSQCPAIAAEHLENKATAALANMAVVKFQLGNLSRAEKLDASVSPLRVLLLQQIGMAFRTLQHPSWLQKYIS